MSKIKVLENKVTMLTKYGTLCKSCCTTCTSRASAFFSAHHLYVQVGSRDGREVTNFARLRNFQLPVFQNVGFLDYSLHNQRK